MTIFKDVRATNLDYKEEANIINFEICLGFILCMYEAAAL